MAEMKSLTLKGKYYEIVDEYARNTIERNCSPVLTETAEGFYNAVEDSANKPLQGLRVFGKTEQASTTGKNLLEITAATHTHEGVTYTINPDGSVIANGTAVGISVCILNKAFVFKAGVSYTMTGCPENGGTTAHRIDDVNRFGDDGSGYTGSYEVDTSREIRIRIANGVTVKNLVFWPMIRLASDTDDTFEPYTGGAPSPSPSYPQSIVGNSSTTVSVTGKNLLPYPYWFTSDVGGQATSNGGTFTNIGNGGVKLSGTPTGYASAILTNNFMIDSDIAISLIGNCSNAILEINIYDENKNVLGAATATRSYVIRKADYPGKATLNMSVKRGVDNVAISGTVFPMIVAGTVPATEYAPYVAPQTFNIPNVLHGMYNKYPDTYSNSYVDSEGNGYITDYVEFEKNGSGRLINRFWVTTLTGEETVSTYRTSDNTDTYFGFYIKNLDRPSIGYSCFQKSTHFSFGTGSATNAGYYPNTFMCHGDGAIYIRTEIEGVNSVDTFKAWLAEQYAAGTPVQFVYVRTEPIVTSLTDAEIAAFKQLYSVYPNTTVMNDNGAWLETDYAADLKLYIQKLLS